MPARYARLIIAAALVLLVVALTAPPIAAADEKGSALVVEGYEVVGNEVLVQVTNLGSSRGSGVVEVRAMAAGLPLKRGVRVSLQAGASEMVPVGFVAQVEGVIVVGISDQADPIL